VTEPGARLQQFAAPWLPRIEAELARLVPAEDRPPAALHRAMRYALFPGGKRLRPVLALLGTHCAGADPARALGAAAALELVHTYSLVHDDLPCMDDDDLRRGRPTCHKVFGEAVAVLAGDALLTLGFAAIASAGSAAVSVLAQAAGSLGMVGGQVLDLEAERRADLTLHDLQAIHDRKTAALIAAALEVGALAGGAAPERLAPLREYGLALGRAFQIADDCLDVTGDPRALGKNVGQDAAAQKLTYPRLLGLEAGLAAARAEAERAAAMAESVVAALAPGGRLDSARLLLQDAALHAVHRRS
jgi:geranylgeranyl diphosphate synthase type II